MIIPRSGQAVVRRTASASDFPGGPFVVAARRHRHLPWSGV